VDLALLLKINDLRRQEAQRNVLNSRGIEERRFPQTLNPHLSPSSA
jgi:hypothetical protein